MSDRTEPRGNDVPEHAEGAITRRTLLAGSGLAGIGLAAGLGGAAAGAAAPPPPPPPAAPPPRPAPPTTTGTTAPAPPAVAVPFYGANQGGIATPAQDHLAFAAFDVVGSAVGSLQALLQKWTAAAAAMTSGQPVPGDSTTPSVSPADTWEVAGLPASDLTLTVGFGPSLFDGRFGLAPRRPAALVEIPPFAGDQLQAQLSGGDLAVQACANDPKVAFHAVHDLAKMGQGVVALRWVQFGFNRDTAEDATLGTPRNLMGFKDGTLNIDTTDAATMAQYVWVGDESDQAWMSGGSYLVSRRIVIDLARWDADELEVQEAAIGRAKISGAPLGEEGEFDPLDLAAVAPGGAPVIPANAHVRLTSPAVNGTQILRRGYNFADGAGAPSGALEAGLFFVAFQQNPTSQFIAIQQRLSQSDALGAFLAHTGSAIFACPGGLAPGEWWGQGLWS